MKLVQTAEGLSIVGLTRNEIDSLSRMIEDYLSNADNPSYGDVVSDVWNLEECLDEYSELWDHEPD